MSLVEIVFASIGIFVLEGISVELPGIILEDRVTTSGFGGNTVRVRSWVS